MNPWPLLLLLALATAPAHAAKWLAVSDNGQVRLEFDLLSLEKKDKTVTAWDQETYRELGQAFPGDFSFKSSKSLARYYCNNRTLLYLTKVFYADDGSEIKTLTAVELPKLGYIVPDSPEETKFEYACHGKTTIAVAPKPKPLPRKVVRKKAAPKTATAEKDKADKKPAAAEKPASTAKKTTLKELTKDKQAKPQPKIAKYPSYRKAPARPGDKKAATSSKTVRASSLSTRQLRQLAKERHAEKEKKNEKEAAPAAGQAGHDAPTPMPMPVAPVQEMVTPVPTPVSPVPTAGQPEAAGATQ